MNQVADASAASSPVLAKTPLYELHKDLGARLVGFAGYEMPIQYPTGIIAEHLAARASAGLFDVSHMGQAILEGAGVAGAFESLVPADILGLAPGRTRYTQFLDENAGILDDLMVTRMTGAPERLFIVCNAATKSADFELIARGLPDFSLKILDDRALLALQGPQAADALAAILPGVENLSFMSMAPFSYAGAELLVWRSGYTGEDGFEISIPAAAATAFAEKLLTDSRVKPIGLGARDSLRLEAGLCLYGHDIDPSVTPLEAGLMWSIAKRRREQGGFCGAESLQAALKTQSEAQHGGQGEGRRRVGLLLEGRAPAREGAEIVAPNGDVVGKVTSGGFSPSLGQAIAMGYVAAAYAREGDALAARVRGKLLAAKIVRLPFVAHKYRR